MPSHEVRLRNAAGQLHNYRMDHVVRGETYEIEVDFFAESAVSSLLLWTSIDARLRVKIGAGAYLDVGDSRDTAADLGAFTEGETKQGTIEIEYPCCEEIRHEELALNLGYGIGE
jgi:hypothetical protein